MRNATGGMEVTACGDNSWWSHIHCDLEENHGGVTHLYHDIGYDVYYSWPTKEHLDQRRR